MQFYVGLQIFFSARSHYFAKFAISNLIESFQLNAFALHYCEL